MSELAAALKRPKSTVAHHVDVLARNGLTIWGTAITGGRPQNVRSAIIDVSGAPVVDGDAIFASNQAGRTTRIDAATGERAWTMDEGSYGPAWPVGGSIPRRPPRS